jgi:hypothetical protein
MSDTTQPEPTVEEVEAAEAAKRDKAERKKLANSFTAAQMEGMRGMTFSPRNFDEVWFLAGVFASSGGMVPECFRGEREAAAMAVMWGLELGISPLQAIQGIAIIGGRPAIWGDLLHALVLTHPDFESFKEETILDNGVIVGARCTTKRKGFEAVTRQFTMEDAANANLLKKDTWVKYRTRMLQMRARSWAHRDAMPHAIRGLASADELIDVDAREIASSKPGRDLAGNPLEVPMPRARVAHEVNPLNDLVKTDAPDDMEALERTHAEAAKTAAVDFRDLETDFATPASGITREEAASDDALAEHEARVRAATPVQSALLGPGPGKELPLSEGGRATLQAYLDATDGRVTLQDVQDWLGGSVTATSLGRSLAWITEESNRRSAESAS